MALDSANVDVAVTGTVSYAPVGSTAPTDAITVLDATFLDVGYISEDGVVEARDRSTNNIIVWQNAETVRTSITEASITVNFTMVETNPNSLALFYGASVDGTDGSIEIVPAQTGGRRSFVVDYVDGEKFVRLYIPQGEVTEVGEVTLANSDPVGYEVTLYGYPDATSGFTAKKWFSALVVTP